MLAPESDKIQTFTSANDLGLWFKVNHAIESELWVKIFKVKTGIISVTWDDVVVESLCCAVLCCAWIDGTEQTSAITFCAKNRSRKFAR